MLVDGIGDGQRRELLVAALERVRGGLPLGDLLGSDLAEEQAQALLLPMAGSDARIDWIGGNGERVDALIAAGDRAWRVVFGAATGATIDWLATYERPARFEGVSGGRAVVVNGPSGAGKSTLLNAMQQMAAVPLVVLDEPEHIGTVQPAYLVWRDTAPMLHRGYLEAIGTLARCGNYVGVSAAGHGQPEFVGAFRDVPLLWVGLTCDLDVLRHRERRTGRWGGIAAASLDAHDGWHYDLEFDTTEDPDPRAMAHRVLERLIVTGETDRTSRTND